LHANAAAQAVITERLPIAREMHDSVAHSIGIIALQAGAAARVAETQPARAREAMRTVEKTGRETPSGLQHMLGVLRETDHDEDVPAPLQPGAGLADIDRLASSITAASIRVRAWWKGTRRPVLRTSTWPRSDHPGIRDQYGPALRRRFLPGEHRLPRRRTRHRDPRPQRHRSHPAAPASHA
jgi:histidine kinase